MVSQLGRARFLIKKERETIVQKELRERNIPSFEINKKQKKRLDNLNEEAREDIKESTEKLQTSKSNNLVKRFTKLSTDFINELKPRKKSKANIKENIKKFSKFCNKTFN